MGASSVGKKSLMAMRRQRSRSGAVGPTPHASDFALTVEGQAEIVPITVGIHKIFVEAPAAVAMGSHRVDPASPDLSREAPPSDSDCNADDRDLGREEMEDRSEPQAQKG
jgi:hypothetical protein